MDQASGKDVEGTGCTVGVRPVEELLPWDNPPWIELHFRASSGDFWK
jgi:hypothetical protein